MTDRKRTTAIQVRVTEQEKWKLERQARRCGLSLSGYLRRVGTGKPAARTAAQLDDLAGEILTAYTSEGTDDGDN